MANKAAFYVCGFLIDTENCRVALIRKNKPDFQRGKLNGIGGKIEPGETPYTAMIREFKEETGAEVTGGWSSFCTLRVESGPAEIDFYVNPRGHGVELRSLTDEDVGWHSLRYWDNSPHMRNLKWLIPLALEHLDNRKSALVLSQNP